MSQRRLTATLVATLLICLLGGGAGAFFLGQRSQQDSAAAQTPPVRHTVTRTSFVTASASPGGDRTSTDGGSDSVPTSSIGRPPTGPAPATTTMPTDDTEVRLSAEAQKDPDAKQVADVLQRFFDAINTGDYQKWATTVTPEQVKAIPKGRWAKDYSTTKDTGITVVTIEGDPRRAHLTFRSRQRPEFAPDKKSTCTDWKVTLPLTDVGGSLLLGESVSDLASYTPCEG